MVFRCEMEKLVLDSSDGEVVQPVSFLPRPPYFFPILIASRSPQTLTDTEPTSSTATSRHVAPSIMSSAAAKDEVNATLSVYGPHQRTQDSSHPSFSPTPPLSLPPSLPPSHPPRHPTILLLPRRLRTRRPKAPRSPTWTPMRRERNSQRFPCLR